MSFKQELRNRTAEAEAAKAAEAEERWKRRHRERAERRAEADRFAKASEPLIRAGMKMAANAALHRFEYHIGVAPATDMDSQRRRRFQMEAICDLFESEGFAAMPKTEHDRDTGMLSYSAAIRWDND